MKFDYMELSDTEYAIQFGTIPSCKRELQKPNLTKEQKKKLQNRIIELKTNKDIK